MEPCRYQKAAFARKGRAGRALLLCLVVLGFGQLCFVQGWPAPIKDKILTSKIQCFVREKRRQDEPGDKDVRIITSKIKDTQTAGDLLDYVDTVVDKPSFNYIHVAATYTKLGNFQKKGQLDTMDADSGVLVRLESRLQGMLVRRQVEAQALSNILWAFASLFSDIPAVLKAVPAVAEQVPGKASDMIEQHLSNCLWAAAQLQHVERKVLKIVPAIVQQIPSHVGEMNEQHLSNILWAAAQLQQSARASDVLSIVPEIVEHIPLKARSMTAQGLANTVEALVFLRETFPINQQPSVANAVSASAARLSLILDRLQGKDLQFAVPVVVWACGQYNLYDAKLFKEVSELFSQRQRVLALMPPWDLCALNLRPKLEAFALDVRNWCGGHVSI